MSWILGIGGSKHDYAACLLRDGNVEVAVEEERVSRKKRGYGVDPAHAASIGYCLDAYGLTIGQIEAVAVNDLLDSAMYEALERPHFVFGHHLTHAASAWFASPFERAAVLVVDHSGGRFRDGDRLVAETFSAYRAIGNELTLLERVVGEDESGSPAQIPDDLRGNAGIDALKRPRNSIGRLYARVSRRCECVTRMGDGELHTESGKLMGLAAFGDDRHVGYLRSLVSLGDTIHIDIGPPTAGLEAYCRRVLADAAARGERELFAERAALAFAAQQVLEDVIVHAARRLQRLSGEHNLCLAGGVALNGVANHRILERTDFR
ncbi:MAG TPA: carbamoyltransferase N-terminal domain-containing protein, partial [Gemmatimonadaceae bacterium]|nr:carbamoyltransferase N-terminal domain-containing protein [Gemmatimonadaceae bacterium]